MKMSDKESRNACASGKAAELTVAPKSICRQIPIELWNVHFLFQSALSCLLAITKLYCKQKSSSSSPRRHPRSPVKHPRLQSTQLRFSGPDSLLNLLKYPGDAHEPCWLEILDVLEQSSSTTQSWCLN